MTVLDDDMPPEREPEGDSLPMKAAHARSLVRDAVAACAAEAGLTQASAECLAHAELACSELVANARRHGGGMTAFEVHAEDGHVVIAVTDRSPVLPHSPRHDPLEPGGFGWALVKTVATSTDVTVLPGRGKVIVAVLPVH